MSLLIGDTKKVWQDIELRAYHDPFCTSSQIYRINERSRSKTPLNPNTSLKWVFVYITRATYSKSLTKYTTFSNYLLILYAYYKIP